MMNGVRWIDELARDLRYAFRQLRHGPGFSAVIVATLALGIGGTTAVFSVMHAVLLAPLPYTPEIGIRIALGASAAQLRVLVLRQAAVVLGIGIVGGIGGALLLGRWLSWLLFQTSPWDARIIVGTAVLLSITGIVAAWLPARRAWRIEARIAMQEG
jgi:predicted lysophospholipase L1 biosynthesis ABC-type transport system permease subunit